MAQLDAISLQGAVSALVAARQHLLAARACRQLGLDVSQARMLGFGLLCWAACGMAASDNAAVTAQLLTED